MVWLRGQRPVALLVLLGLLLVACDGGSDSADTTPTEQSTAGGGSEQGEAAPGGGPLYVGARPGIPVEAVPFGDRRVQPTVLETSGDSLVTRVRWQGWGAAEAIGRGVARVNSCEPSCAQGALIRRPGAVATLSDVRRGDCGGRAARFYAHAVVEWPSGLGLPQSEEFRLLPRCAEVG